MKPITFCFLLFGSLILTGATTFAQNKLGCISMNELMTAMPEFKKADTTLAQYAIQQVSKDNGYAFIFEKESLHAFPPSEDILPLVKKRLGLR